MGALKQAIASLEQSLTFGQDIIREDALLVVRALAELADMPATHDARIDEGRVFDDSFRSALDAARSNIGPRRPQDEEPEDQWYWDKLTRMVEILEAE